MFNINNYISGERIQQICPVYCGSDYDLHRNPTIAMQQDKHINIDNLNTEWDNPTLLFCYNCSLITLKNKLHLLKNKFILVSHNEDNNINETYLDLVNSPLIIKWFSQNVMLNHPKLFMLPIGLANAMWPHGNLDIIHNIMNLNIQKEEKIYFYFNLNTNYKERIDCKTKIEEKGLTFGSLQTYSDYLKELSTCKFAICPPGNGIDCHRTWECYYLNVIPILLRSTFTEHLQQNLPCIILDSWDDFNYSDIIQKYDTYYTLLQENRKFIELEYYKNSILSYVPFDKYTLKEYNTYKSYSHVDSKTIPFDYKLDWLFQKTNGFFVEVGANDGLLQSNTAFFEFYRNWKGLLIEPSLIAYNKCVVNRSNSTCFNYACVSHDYPFSQIEGDFDGNMMSSVYGNRLQSNNLIKVNTITLDDLFDRNNITTIDLLSIDTEGYELSILKGLDLHKYRPKYMLIELYTHNLQETITYLQSFHYSLIENFSNYNKHDNPHWDETHNDYLFVDNMV